jgi:GTP-binding protein
MPGGKISGQIEKYSVLRSFKAIDESDVVLLLIDAVDGITAQDLHIAGYAKDQYKGIIIVVNKWDAVEKDEKDMAKFLNMLHNKINFLPFAPAVFVSAKTGKNVDKIKDLILEVKKNREKRVPTGELNAKLGTDILRKPPAAKRGVLPKINYITQAEISPPTFVFFTNHPDIFHFSYVRYLENRIRDHWEFAGTPIRIIFKPKHEDYNKKKRK